jgi:hypothetical protein
LIQQCDRPVRHYNHDGQRRAREKHVSHDTPPLPKFK